MSAGNLLIGITLLILAAILIGAFGLIDPNAFQEIQLFLDNVGTILKEFLVIATAGAGIIALFRPSGSSRRNSFN